MLSIMINDIETFVSLKYEILDYDTTNREIIYDSYPHEVKVNWHKRCTKYHNDFICGLSSKKDWAYYKRFLIEELCKWELKQPDNKK